MSAASRLRQHLIATDETAETVSGADLRAALEHGFDCALAETSRDAIGCRTDIEKRMFYRGYDSLACEPVWLKSNR